MASAVKKLGIEEEYLMNYVNSEDPRYELINNVIVAMSPPSDIHMLISKNLTRHIDVHMENTNSKCKLFPEHKKVKAELIGKNYCKPDLLVECGVIDKDFSRNPILIIEILSSNRKTDLEDKFKVYTSIDSLLEYFVIEQAVMEVKVFRRRNDWKPEIYTEKSIVHFESIGLELEIEKIYREIQFNEDGIAYVI